ncbi:MULTISPECIES: FAD-dependent monooxygenase [unclassified Streptomyces]|uniref:FAD-dependent monooxygenase n=1 Tax=unclassified Streptomyces TaxID=2593676 RepID=UPI002E80B918|nr:FAD-dependent monooxygenase [Streptomyces sp. NBC_00589]WTI41668.1 FAD-dependent monooxygenase [Streptomyces sp. NBC_00775]WUB24649.1 FAD-dependent monooxygenase [Streptomyces sp. NBC_00589]
MKIACVGGGPASLYFSILMKRQDPSHDIAVYERNPAGSTYGWGVTYWSGLLDKLHEGDPESALAVSENSVRWSDGVAHVGDRTTVHHGDEGFGIGRRRMLDLLAERAASLGVRVEFEHEVTPGRLPDADLVVAGDGVNSALRERHADHFGSEITLGRNIYIWLGTTKVFDSFTFSFVETDHGWIWCYAYRFSDDHSTLVVECSPETWTGLGLDRAGEADGLALLEKLFADLLDGHGLIGRAQADGSAQWLNFRTLTNRTWHRGNLVLLGDAAHTTHYSIGAGTTLALEDAISLAGALRDHQELESALAHYERERRSALLSVQSAARHSAQWYENLPRYIRLPPAQMFALLGQRHSPLLPYIPPQLYYRIDRAAGQLEALRRFKRWLGPRVARTVQARSHR